MSDQRRNPDADRKIGPWNLYWSGWFQLPTIREVAGRWTTIGYSPEGQLRLYEREVRVSELAIHLAVDPDLLLLSTKESARRDVINLMRNEYGATAAL